MRSIFQVVVKMYLWNSQNQAMHNNPTDKSVISVTLIVDRLVSKYEKKDYFKFI